MCGATGNWKTWDVVDGEDRGGRIGAVERVIQVSTMS